MKEASPMRSTTVVNLRREPYDVYVGSPGPFGNPFAIGRDGTREEVIEKHRVWFYEKVRASHGFAREAYERCAGKRLGCYCKPLACHGDTIAEWCNAVSIQRGEK